MGLKKSSTAADIGMDAKPAWKVWGTEEYERSLSARFPHTDQRTINSLIAVAHRIAEKEIKNRQ